jgi:riboflavin synthase
MFTGIVTDKGLVREIRAGGDRRFVFATAYDTRAIDLGASIACSGACLTVVERETGWFAADVSAETLARTTLGSWSAGTPVNLERALKLGDELGGHLVTGHVDGVAELVERRVEGGSLRLVFAAPAALRGLIATKGSVALDGVSLTVNAVEDDTFSVLIIPHTLAVTTLGTLAQGDDMNLEIDTMARYAARLMEAR